VSYQPQPIDTARVELPADVVQLIERLARNAHEVWAAERIAQGWAHGPRRDDARKHHPSLIPFNQLAESEKQIDRAMATQIVKAILALGYRVERA